MGNSEEYVKYLMWSVHLTNYDVDKFEGVWKFNLKYTNLYVCEGFSHNNGFDKKKICQKIIDVK